MFGGQLIGKVKKDIKSSSWRITSFNAIMRNCCSHDSDQLGQGRHAGAYN